MLMPTSITRSHYYKLQTLNRMQLFPALLHPSGSYCAAKRNQSPFKAEKEKQRLSQKEDYASEFWFWAQGFLQETPYATMQTGQSVAMAVREEPTINSGPLPGNAKNIPNLRRRLLANVAFQCTE